MAQVTKDMTIAQVLQEIVELHRFSCVTVCTAWDALFQVAKALKKHRRFTELMLMNWLKHSMIIWPTDKRIVKNPSLHR